MTEKAKSKSKAKKALGKNHKQKPRKVDASRGSDADDDVVVVGVISGDDMISGIYFK